MGAGPEAGQHLLQAIPGALRAQVDRERQPARVRGAERAEVPALARAQHEAAAELVLGQVAFHQQDAVAREQVRAFGEGLAEEGDFQLPAAKNVKY